MVQVLSFYYIASMQLHKTTRIEGELAMLRFFLLAIAFSSHIALATPEVGTVHHPAPKDPIYLSKGSYEAIKKTLPLPPKPKSKEQNEDEKTLIGFQESRSAQDCEAAKSEVLVSLKSFYGKPYGPLDDQRIEKLAPFFEQVRNDADYFIQRLKKDFPRKRPFLYMRALNPCVPREVTGAYPSGHAVLSKLFALILADFDSQARDQFEARSVEIGKHRVISGMHHPSDVEAGRALASLIYGQLKDSKRYQADFARALALVKE